MQTLSLVSSQTTMADGSVPYAAPIQSDPSSPSTDWRGVGWRTWLPADSVPPIRGRLRLVPGASSRKTAPFALVHARCAAPYGQRCSGVAEVRVGGSVIGKTRYALEGRPGRAAATDALVVQLSRRVRFADLEVTSSPLPARPLLSPARPAWDRSRPY